MTNIHFASATPHAKYKHLTRAIKLTGSQLILPQGSVAENNHKELILKQISTEDQSRVVVHEGSSEDTSDN